MVWGRVIFIGLKGGTKEDFEKESNCFEWSIRKKMRWMEDLEKESNCLEWSTRKGMVDGPMEKEAHGWK